MGLIFKLAQLVKKLSAFRFDGVARCGNSAAGRRAKRRGDLHPSTCQNTINDAGDN